MPYPLRIPLKKMFDLIQSISLLERAAPALRERSRSHECERVEIFFCPVQFFQVTRSLDVRLPCSVFPASNSSA